MSSFHEILRVKGHVWVIMKSDDPSLSDLFSKVPELLGVVPTLS